MFARTAHITALAGFLLSASLSAAQAVTVLDWSFSFDLGNGVTASGTLVTSDTDIGGQYLAKSLTGTLTEGTQSYSMSLLAPGGSSLAPGILFNDNEISLGAGPKLDGYGLGFLADGKQWSLWDSGMSYSWCNNGGLGQNHYCSFSQDPNGSASHKSFAAAITAVVTDAVPPKPEPPAPDPIVPPVSDPPPIIPVINDPPPVVMGVPEPSSWALMMLGFAGVGFLGYRRRRAAIAC